MFAWLRRIGLRSLPASPAPNRQPPQFSPPASGPEDATPRQAVPTARVGARQATDQPAEPLLRPERPPISVEAHRQPQVEKSRVDLPGEKADRPRFRLIVQPGYHDADAAPGPHLSRRGDVRWYPPGSPVTVHGLTIPDGMVYVGDFIAACPGGGGWGGDTPAPCLINPNLRIATKRPNLTTDMGYWPSYSDITPSHRTGYLQWLAKGKRDAECPLGYVFLYFYGIERRVIVDDISPDEEQLLVAELHRLREIYASNRSFNRYSANLLHLVELRQLMTSAEGLDNWRPDLNTIYRDMPLPLRVKLAIYAYSGIAADFDHAMGAVLAIYPALGFSRKEAVPFRARTEFMKLARHRFRQQFPKGFVLRPHRDCGPLFLQYRAASQYLQAHVALSGPQLPESNALDWREMIELCERVAADLAPYAKAVGKDRQRADSLEAALALPPELLDADAIAPIQAWLSGLPNVITPVSLDELGRRCFGEGKAVSGLKRAQQFSAMLARVGYGMEPDPSHGGEKPSGKVMLFRAADASGTTSAPGRAFQRAALVSSLLRPIASKPESIARMVSELASRLNLTSAETVRLAARQTIMEARVLPPGRIRSLASTIPAGERPAVATLAAEVAVAAGDIGPEAVKALEQLYGAFGIESRSLYSTLHHGTAAVASKATEPVTVERGNDARKFRIPRPPDATKAHGDSVSIDMTKVTEILRETREVAEVLADIYDEEQAAKTMPVTAEEPKPVISATRFPGLKVEHARLLAALCFQEKWDRLAFEAKAREFGLMPDGAIETINEWAYDTLDDEVIEDGNPLTVSLALLRETPGETA